MTVQTGRRDPSVTRIAIDWDDDGAFALVTRPGAAAERIPLSHRDVVRLMSEAAQVVLVEDGRRQQAAQSANRAGLSRQAHVDATVDTPPHFIGMHGE